MTDYKLDRLLKRGAGVETWLGREPTSGKPVVVRLVTGGSPTLWNRLTHEARVLAELDGGSVLEVTPGRLVRAYVAGATLEERLHNGPLDPSEALALFAGLCDRLEQVHARGVLHGDLKPANLVVSTQALVPIDFGLARLGPERLEAAGSPAYLAPEASGLLRRPLGPPTDLYALGATLYHALSGRPPFVHPTPREVLRAHLVETPEPLARLPRGLNEVVQRLLAKEPADRYQSAAALADHLRTIGAGGVPSQRREGRQEPAFTGRTAELEALQKGLDEGGLILVEGEPGAGKSRLLDELNYWAQGQGVTVVRAQADTGVTPRPLALLAALLSAPGDVDGDDVDRVADQLALELEGLAPALVLLDDVQWADGLSLEVLTRWTRLPHRRLAVVASRRTGYPEPAWLVGRRLNVDPLDLEALRALAESMRGAPLHDEELERLAEVSGGNPFLAVETMRGEGLETTLRGAHFLARRLEGLGSEAAGLLRAAAVLGRTCTLSLLHEVYPFSWEALAEARTVGLLWQESDGETLRLPHDRIREALLAQLSEADRRSLHLRAAEHAETRDDEFAAAYHFSEAGEDARACPYALKAARVARLRSDLPTSGEYYRRALRGSVDSRIRAEAGEVMLILGWYHELLELLAPAEPDPQDDLARLHLLGRAYNGAGLMSESWARYEELRERGAELPSRVTWRSLRLLAPPRPSGRARPSPEMERTIRILLDHTQTSAHFGHVGVALEGLEWAVDLACRYPDSASSAEALALLSSVQCQFGLGKTSRATARVAEEWVRRIDAVPARGKCLTRIASAYCTTAPLTVSLERFLEADALLTSTRDYWESGAARYFYGTILRAVGRFELLAESGRSTYHNGVRLNQPGHRAIGLCNWSMGTGGEGLWDLVEAELAVQTDSPLRETSLGVAAGLGRPALGATMLSRTHRGSPLFQAYADTWAATFAREAAEALPLVPGKERRRYLEQARRAVRRGVRSARRIHWAFLPQCLREAGLLAFLDGRPARARALLEESLNVAEGLEAPYEAAVTRQERARLGTLLGWAEAEEGPAAEAELRRLGAHWRLPAEWTQPSSGSPLDRLLEQGQAVLRGEQPPAEGEPQVVAFLHGLHRTVAEREAAESRQRQAEEALEASRRRFEALFQATGVGLGWRDGKGALRLANPMLRAILGGGELPWPLPAEGPLRGGGDWLRWLVSPTVDGHLVTVVPSDPSRRLQMAALQHAEDRVREGSVAQLAGPVQELLVALRDHPQLAEEMAALERELRSIPASLTELPAPEAARESLAACVRSFSDRTGLDVELVLPDALPPLPDLSAQALLRIVDEALANVQRHARARRVEVRVTVEDGSLRGIVADDGRGLSGDPDPVRLGLRGMRFRAELAGGEWRIAGDERGTRVEFRLPVGAL